MAKLTITEALQEIKTINNRLQKKRGSISEYLARDARVKDPLERDGGSEAFIKRERQSISDLEQRVISIRTAIQRSNLDTKTTLGETTRTVAEWLTWRREIANESKAFLAAISTGLRNLRAEVQKKGGRMVANIAQVNEFDQKAPPEVVVNVDEKRLIEEQEQLETTLGDLDGRLSLLNATTLIEV